MADWNNPTLTSLYADMLSELKTRDDDAAKMFDGVGTNLPVGAIKWSATNEQFEKWSGTVWGPLSTFYNINVNQVDGCDVNDLGTTTTALWSASKIQTQLNNHVAATATKLATPRTITVSGDLSATPVAFDGTTNINIITSVNDDSHNHIQANIDGLDTTLAGKLDITAKAADSDKLDNLNSTSFLRSDADNTTATGIISTSAVVEAGRGSGGVAWTVNDGYGNSNICFNHKNGIPDATGSSARITSSVDSATASMDFQVKNSTTTGVAVAATSIMTLAEDSIALKKPLTTISTIAGRDVATDGSKLDGIEAGATGDQTAAEILAALLTVDGAGTGLDADKLDNVQANQFIRSDVADIKTSGDMTFNDGVYLRLGTGGDFGMQCNGLHAYMDLGAGIGNLYVRDGTTTRFTFDDVGDFTATGNVTAYSDRKLKTNIELIPGALGKITGLSGYTFDRIDNPEVGRQTGVIAQEVLEVLPEAVTSHTNPETGEETLTVAYGNMVGLLIEGIKEQQELINNLMARVEELERI